MLNAENKPEVAKLVRAIFCDLIGLADEDWVFDPSDNDSIESMDILIDKVAKLAQLLKVDIYE
jgi:hypothetical protein